MEDRPLPTVAITGAGGQVGRALLERLQGARVAPVAITRTAARLPVEEHVVGSLYSAPAQAALGRADYIVHLAGTLRPIGNNSYRAANLETAEAVARAVRGGRARRLLMLSFVGAAVDSPDEYLRTKALAERVLVATGKEVVVFRCGHIIGSPDAPGPTAAAFLAGGGNAVLVFGSGRQLVARVYLGDVATALVAALRRGPPGVYDLVGPDRMTMDELERLVNGERDIRIRHLPSWLARSLGRLVPSLPSALVDVMLRDSLGDGSAARAAFGICPTSLKTIWREPADRPAQPVGA
ncbi:MAG: NAD-dependent epimerase/dehydratase family protein [Chloroflexota bacterium]|nr:NAD-dependent epimerase/dehydratase family protein [Chloroflexota bacterium]